MSALWEVQQAVRRLSAGERKLLSAWINQELDVGSPVSEPPANYGAAAPERRRFTFEEYLEIERSTPLRHEYVAGEVLAMGQPSQAHEIIVMNLAGPLHAHLRGRPCRAYAGGRRLQFECRGDEIGYYPDVWVGCGETRKPNGGFEDEPRLVIEVISPSTARIDRREKAMNYRAIGSLEEIVLIAQEPVSVMLYRRADRWLPTAVDSPEGVLELRSIGLTLTVGRVYEGLP